MTVRALEVRIRQGKSRPDIARFTKTLGQLTGALKEIDRAAVFRAPRPSWVLEDLRHQGDFFNVRLTAKAKNTRRDPETLLLPVEALVGGVRDLAEEPQLPRFYSEATVTRLLRIGEPTEGVREVSLAMVNGRVGQFVGLTDAVLEHARHAVREHEVSIGSLTGVLDILNARSLAGGVRVSIFDPASRRAVSGTAGKDLTDEMRHAWGHRVMVRGRITRNDRGQAVRISISHVDRLPDDDRGRPTTEELLGVDPGWVGDRTVDEFMREARRRA